MALGPTGGIGRARQSATGRGSRPDRTRLAASIPGFGVLRLLLLAVFMMVSVLSCQTAHAQPVDPRNAIAAQAVFEDPTNALNFAEARTKDFVPYTGIYNRGFSQSTFWFRLDLDPALGQSSPGGFADSLFVLRILPSFLDEIELFDPHLPDNGPRITGTRVSGRSDEYKSHNYHFVIHDLDQPRTIWIRLKTNSSTIILFELLRLPALTLADQQQALFYGIYLGVIFLTFVLALLITHINYDKVVVVFAVKQAATLLWAFIDRGFYRLMFDDMPEPLSITTARLYVSFFLVISSLYFDYLFLKAFKSSRLGQYCQIILISAVALTFVLFLSGHYALGIKINMMVITCGIILAWLIALSLPQAALLADPDTRSVPKYSIVLSYSTVLLLLMPAVLPLVGIVPATGLTLNALLYHGLLSSIALASVLGLRARAIVWRQIELQNELELSQRLAEEERHTRIEQSKFMAMLSHEVKTTLTGIRMAAATESTTSASYQQITDAVDDIDHIIERCLHAERLHEGNVTLQRDIIDFGTIVQTLCRRHTQAHRIDLSCDPLPPIRSDAQILKVVLSNLIDNACKYSATDTQVTITAAVIVKDGARDIMLTCANLPIYQDWPEPRKLFSKYYRSQLAHRVTGSGLGLYLASQFIDLLGGTLTYTPSDKEVVLTLTLPVSA